MSLLCIPELMQAFIFQQVFGSFSLRLAFSFASAGAGTNLYLISLKYVIGNNMVGENDQRTTVIESKNLFPTASQPKELWLIDGAKHQNLHRYTPAAYEYRILKFFEKHLRSDDT